MRVLAAGALVFLNLAATTGFAQSGSLPTYGFSPAGLPGVLGADFAVIGDFNGDGFLDIATSHGFFTIGYSAITVSLGDGKGNFALPVRSTVMPVARAMAVADFNRDGKSDLLAWTPVAGAGSGGRIVILLANGDGTFSQKVDYPAPGSSSPNGGFPGLLADFNGDGFPDIALVNVTPNNIDVILGNGDGTFRAAGAYSTAQEGLAFALAGDVDGDGTLDLIAVNKVVGNSAGDIAILRGMPAGAFAQAANAMSITPGVPSQSVFAGAYADLNNDHKGDLVIVGDYRANYPYANVSTFVAKGDGTFALNNSFASLSSSPFPIVIADMTGDGNADLVISTFARVATLYIFPGRGDGTFDSPAIYVDPLNSGFATPTSSLSIGDLNGDGRLDVVITPNGDSAAILWGIAAPFLRTRVTHNGDFFFGQNDATFDVYVSNAGNALMTAGKVTVNDVALDNSYDIMSLAGQGWTCSGGYACSRDDALPPGASYPPIIIRIDLNHAFGGGAIRNSAVVSGGGSAGSQVTDTANVLPYQQYCLFALDAPHSVSVGVDGADNIPLGVSGASPQCPFNIRARDPWITLNGGPIVAPNNTGLPRTSSINFVSPTGWQDSIVVNQAGSPGCVYQLWPPSETVGPILFTNSITVLTAVNCIWTATSSAPWITVGPTSSNSPNVSFGPTASGDGRTLAYVHVTPNLTGQSRSGTITVSGQTFTVSQTASDNPSALGSLPHWAAGGGWESSIELLNTNNSLAQTSIHFYDDSGSERFLPFSSPDDASPASPWRLGTVPFVHALPASSTYELDIRGTGAKRPSDGAAQLLGDAGVGGFVRFRYLPTQQEAVVPLEIRNARSYTLTYDNTSGFATGVAIDNRDAQTAIIAVTYRDTRGATIGSDTITLPPWGHMSFMVTERLPLAANGRGTVEFDTPPGPRIAVLGLRFSPSGTFTTTPVMTDNEAGTGKIAQLAAGGGWGSTITLVNTGTTAASTKLQFFDDSGNALALAITFPQENSGLNTTTSVQRSIAPHSMLIVETSGSSNGPVMVGSAQLAGDAGIGAFVVFHTDAMQEAAVPLQPTGTNSYFLAFDNTNSRQTGLALTIGQAGATGVLLVLRDQNGVQLDSKVLSIPTNGHASFMLADRFPASINKRGTLQISGLQGTTIGLTGLSFAASGAFTTIPPLPK